MNISEAARRSGLSAKTSRCKGAVADPAGHLDHRGLFLPLITVPQVMLIGAVLNQF